MHSVRQLAARWVCISVLAAAAGTAGAQLVSTTDMVIDPFNRGPAAATQRGTTWSGNTTLRTDSTIGAAAGHNTDALRNVAGDNAPAAAQTQGRAVYTLGTAQGGVWK